MVMNGRYRKEKSRLFGTVIILFGVYLAGFVAFVFTVPSMNSMTNTRQPLQADAIVALTGGDARLEAAVSLLENGIGQRLLISGVAPQTTKEKLRHLLHGGPRFDCCVDLGFAATDTHGNAREAVEWATSHGYKSLIVVTAAYHMPRSLLEFGAEMPDVRLIPYPVEIDVANPAFGWNLETVRILNGEYVKYVASLVRIAFVRSGRKSDNDTAQR